ncbi:MAG: ZIP family metal transporter [Patescibacteria group bacterium]|nr:ZIP family metal transporter [Patescibacteria group bacterium]
MAQEFIYIIVSLLLVSAVSLVGIFILALKQEIFGRLLPVLVAFAAGALLGAGFFDLIPESLHELGDVVGPFYILVGIMLFMLLESILHWHHAHHHQCDGCHPTPTGYAILLGDGLHNFLDGVLIASAFMLNIPTGLSVALAVVIHEIPQEIGDFAVLIDSGFSRARAIWFNLLSALFAVVGGVVAYFALQSVEGLVPYLVAIGAGGFLYIALVDIVASFKHQDKPRQAFGQIFGLVVGLAILWWLMSQFAVPHA